MQLRKTVSILISFPTPKLSVIDCAPKQTFVSSAAKLPFELIVLKNSCLIEAPIAVSIPLLIGGLGDDGTKAGGARGAVL